MVQDIHLRLLPTAEPASSHVAWAHAGEPYTVRVEGKVWGCQDCLAEIRAGKTGVTWVHLRKCLHCGHIGCCDQSPSKHARAHGTSCQSVRGHAETGCDLHPIIRSFEVGEDWRYCYIDSRMLP